MRACNGAHVAHVEEVDGALLAVLVGVVLRLGPRLLRLLDHGDEVVPVLGVGHHRRLILGLGCNLVLRDVQLIVALELKLAVLCAHAEQSAALACTELCRLGCVAKGRGAGVARPVPGRLGAI